MKDRVRGRFILAVLLFVLFVLFTLIVIRVDVQPIGPMGSSVGLAAINEAVFLFLGVHPFLFRLADWLGYGAILIGLCFAAVGLVQLVQRKNLWKVDHGILLMGALFLVTICFYVIFEKLEVNYRPILLENGLEASYPSSHTVLAVVITGAAMRQLPRLLPGKKGLLPLLELLLLVFMLAVILARLASGAHWFSDIVGGILLSCALVTLYSGLVLHLEKH